MFPEGFDSDLLQAVLVSLIDILVVAYVFYRVLLVIRGPRAQQVLVGLAILVVGFFTSKALGLTTLTWIFDNFIGSFLLIIVVVFQNDIRRLLSRVGKGPLSGPGRSQRGAHLVEQLALAAETMSRQRIGALVLVERDADLSELATQGAAIEVDAELSANLLVQVFTPPGPLHDGAVIIQGDRVGVAAAILPLSQNPQIDTRLGTRHRAALGATEEYDAIALVVSEETGGISLAEAGALTRGLSGMTLRSTLDRYLQRPTQESRFKFWQPSFRSRGPDRRRNPVEDES